MSYRQLCTDCNELFPEGTLQRFEGDFVCDPCINERERMHEEFGINKPCVNCGEMTTGTRPYRDVTDTDRGDWIQEGDEPYCGCDDEPLEDNRGPERGEWRHEAVKAMRLK